MISCGLWPTARQVVAVVVERDGGERAPIKAAHTDDARWALVHCLLDRCTDVVMADEVRSLVAVAELVRRRGAILWLAPAPLVEAIRRASAIERRPPRVSAAMLARLPRIPLLRAYLRRVDGTPACTQLGLWAQERP